MTEDHIMIADHISVLSDFYDVIIEAQGVTLVDGDVIKIDDVVYKTLAMAYAYLGAIRGCYRPVEYPAFCEEIETTMNTLGNLLETLSKGTKWEWGDAEA